MNIGHHFIAGVRSTLKRLRCGQKRYPIIVSQDRLHSPGLLFEVSNEVEEWRVRSLDDEEAFLHLVLAELNINDVFFDIGACVGLFAIHASLHCKRVFAFEPDPGFQVRLGKNCHLNGTSNVTIMPVAVSSTSGTVCLYSGGVSGRSPSICDLGQGAALKVPAMALDDAIRNGLLPNPSVIKMDIEGAELLALQGMQGLLKSPVAPRAIFMEIHPAFLKRFKCSVEEITAFTASAGYEQIKIGHRDGQHHVLLKKASISRN